MEPAATPPRTSESSLGYSVLKPMAVPRPNYSSNFFSPTYHIVKRLNALKQQWTVAKGTKKAELADEMRKEVEILDYFRLLYKVFGSIGA